MNQKSLFLFFITALFATTTFASGSGVRGGGWEYEREFGELAQVFLRTLPSVQANEDALKDFDGELFRLATVETEVYAKGNLCRTMIDSNSGGTSTRCPDTEYLRDQKRIEISIDNWKGKSCIDKMALVVHEYGRAARLENGNYKYSSHVKLSPIFNQACATYAQDEKTQQVRLKLTTEKMLKYFETGDPTSVGKQPSARSKMATWQTDPVKRREAAAKVFVRFEMECPRLKSRDDRKNFVWDIREELLLLYEAAEHSNRDVKDRDLADRIRFAIGDINTRYLDGFCGTLIK